MELNRILSKIAFSGVLYGVAEVDGSAGFGGVFEINPE
jgi:hypothetical protein